MTRRPFLRLLMRGRVALWPSGEGERGRRAGVRIGACWGTAAGTGCRGLSLPSQCSTAFHLLRSAIRGSHVVVSLTRLCGVGRWIEWVEWVAVSRSRAWTGAPSVVDREVVLRPLPSTAPFRSR